MKVEDSYKKGKLIVIEGADGVGKSTQSDLLKIYYETLDKTVKSLHFPTHGEGFYGKLVDKYLNGDFGSLKEVPYYFSAFLYAGNRDENSNKIKKWLSDGNVVLLDRYVSSAKAHQGSNIASYEDRIKFYNWLDRLEYELNEIPKPDGVIVLDADYSTIRESIDNRGRADIHETDENHIKKAIDVYRELSSMYSNWYLLKCDQDGKLKPKNEIHNNILDIVKNI